MSENIWRTASLAEVDGWIAREKAQKARERRERKREERKRKAWLASPEYKAIVALQKAEQRAREVARKAEEARRRQHQIDLMLKRATRWVERQTQAGGVDRARRSRIDWSELIDDDAIVGRQIAWERRATALAMHKAGLKQAEIGKRLGVTSSRASQLLAMARIDAEAGKLSPAEQYMQQDAIGRQPRARAQRLSNTLDVCAYGETRDWLLVGTD